MKVFKELPKSLLYSAYLSLVPASKLCRADKEELPVIVSLTSIPSRLNTLHLVIKCLFNQTHRPKKILLWLNNDLQDKIPARLLSLQSELFEIRYSALNCSHRKLIHSREAYPDDIIITCDDDLIYAKNWLTKLYQQHIQRPHAVIGNKAVQIKKDGEGHYAPYLTWRKVDPNGNSNSFMPVGAWGILYPPKSLAEQFIDQELFLKLTPKADDLWFKAMALLNGTDSLQATDTPNEPIPIIGSQKISLKEENVKKNKNDEQWAQLSQYFKLERLLLGKDKA